MKNIELMSLVEIAIEIQSENSEKTTFIDLYNKVCELKGFSEEERKAHIAQFYTDVTACGDFVYCGDDLWDLKRNQKLEALEKEFQTEHIGFEEDKEESRPKPKRKSSKRAKSPLEIEAEDNREEIESEDQAYETQMTYDDYDMQDEDEDYSSYERDFDSELDEDDTDYDEDDDFDEDKYNSIMDEYENQYDD